MRPDKFFLCFGFENFALADLKPFHVTLIYFGELTTDEIKQVKTIVSQFIDEARLFTINEFSYVFSEARLFTINEFSYVFSEVAMFGANNDIRVLKRHHGSIPYELPWQKANKLFNLLKPFRKHNDFDFNPHLTTDLKFFKGRIDSLTLCKNNYEVVESWELLP